MFGFGKDLHDEEAKAQFSWSGLKKIGGEIPSHDLK